MSLLFNLPPQEPGAAIAIEAVCSCFLIHGHVHTCVSSLCYVRSWMMQSNISYHIISYTGPVRDEQGPIMDKFAGRASEVHVSFLCMRPISEAGEAGRGELTSPRGGSEGSPPEKVFAQNSSPPENFEKLKQFPRI